MTEQTHPDPAVEDHACPLCQIGVCHAEYVTYAHVYNGQLVSMPDMIRYTCDVCGFQEFDQGTVRRLHRLLGFRWQGSSSDRPRRSAASLDTDPTHSKPPQIKP